jgi:growth factor receptor-binding protein 2
LTLKYLKRWFQGHVTRKSSEELLLKKNKIGEFLYLDGNFIIRKSEGAPGDFSASVKFGNDVQQFKIFHKNDTYFIWKSKVFTSLNELVDFHRTNSISNKETILLKDMVEEKSKNLLYKAIYDFKATSEDELSFNKDDILNIINSDKMNEMNGWWEAEKNGVTGLVPSQYFIAV